MCKLVVPQAVQQVAHVVAAAQQHQAPRESEVDKARARLGLTLGLSLVRLELADLRGAQLRREALVGGSWWWLGLCVGEGDR